MIVYVVRIGGMSSAGYVVHVESANTNPFGLKKLN